MEESGIDAYVKYNWFHREQRMHYEPNPFSSQALYYNAEGDYFICPMGQRMNRIGTSTAKTESGYITESARYKAQRCDGCPLRGSCFKAKGNRIIEYNMAYKRFRHIGIDKVNMDFAFFAIAFNLKKMCSIIAKQTQNGENKPQIGLFLLLSQILHIENRIFWKKTKILIA